MTKAKRRWIGMAAVAAAVLLARCGGEGSDVADDQNPQSNTGSGNTTDGGIFTACTTEAQCQPGEVCRANQCQPSEAFLRVGATQLPGVSCLKPSDCSAGNVCVQGKCVTEAIAAAQDGGTPVFFQTDGGFPRKLTCSTDTDCPDNMTCQQGRCARP